MYMTGFNPSLASLKASETEAGSPTEAPVESDDFYFQYDDENDYKTIVDEWAKNSLVEEKHSKLKLHRVLSHKSTVTSGYTTSPTGDEFLHSEKIERFAAQPDRCQVYYIKQRNSHSKLLIDRELLSKIISSYNIFLRFWDQIFNFGPKEQQSDVAHAPFRYRHNNFLQGGYLDECTYGLNYVERNGRDPDGNEDHEPWSVRQCAVYLQYNSGLKRVVLVLIAPSPKGQGRVEHALTRLKPISRTLNPFDLHRILISTALENWRWYIRSLEDRMKIQANRVILAKVDDEDEKLSPLTNFQINFTDRQRLKVLEDRVLDLKIIFDTLLDTIASLENQCRKAHDNMHCKECNCLGIAAEFQEQKQEIKMNQKKTETLQMRAQGTANLLSDLLDYENAHALKVLAEESKDLTEKNTKDAAAINIVIIITLVYLPVTVIASIFSSQLIIVDESGNVSVASGAWWFAALSVPLTIITIVAWRAWVAWAARIDAKRHLKRKSAAIRCAGGLSKGVGEGEIEMDSTLGRKRKGILNYLQKKRYVFNDSLP